MPKTHLPYPPEFLRGQSPQYALSPLAFWDDNSLF